MEKMPYQPEFETQMLPRPATRPAAPRTDWRAGLPDFVGSLVTLRELRLTDAPALLAALTAEQVSRFISPPPKTVGQFERFILWTHRRREEGEYICYAVVPRGSDCAIGIFQVRA